MTDPAAHTPDSAGTPDVDTLVETVKRGILPPHTASNRHEHKAALAALSDLAATAREVKHFRNAADAMFAQKVDAEADRDRAQALADTQEKWAKSEHERAERLARRVAELEAELAHLADMHHRTIRNSRLHDPETIADFRDCPCLPCCRAAAALDGEVLTEEADDPDDAIDDDGMGHQEWRFS